MESNDEKLVATLVSWYKHSGRKNLPWRKTRDPYRILVAEMMLQKTHAVQQVLPVFQVFMLKYPDVQTLAKASTEEIKVVIDSLGLQNTRSRRLKETATTICQNFGGKVPSDYGELVSLQGVGEYVANAVLCMAFGERAAMVDANFGRVLGRLFFGKEDYPPSRDKTYKIASELLPHSNWKDFNLGILDLGALICTPISPKCQSCPLSKNCFYRAREPG